MMNLKLTLCLILGISYIPDQSYGKAVDEEQDGRDLDSINRISNGHHHGNDYLYFLDYKDRYRRASDVHDRYENAANPIKRNSVSTGSTDDGYRSEHPTFEFGSRGYGSNGFGYNGQAYSGSGFGNYGQGYATGGFGNNGQGYQGGGFSTNSQGYSGGFGNNGAGYPGSNFGNYGQGYAGSGYSSTNQGPSTGYGSGTQFPSGYQSFGTGGNGNVSSKNGDGINTGRNDTFRVTNIHGIMPTFNGNSSTEGTRYEINFRGVPNQAVESASNSTRNVTNNSTTGVFGERDINTAEKALSEASRQADTLTNQLNRNFGGSAWPGSDFGTNKFGDTSLAGRSTDFGIHFRGVPNQGVGSANNSTRNVTNNNSTVVFGERDINTAEKSLSEAARQANDLTNQLNRSFGGSAWSGTDFSTNKFGDSRFGTNRQVTADAGNSSHLSRVNIDGINGRSANITRFNVS